MSLRWSSDEHGGVVETCTDAQLGDDKFLVEAKRIDPAGL